MRSDGSIEPGREPDIAPTGVAAQPEAPFGSSIFPDRERLERATFEDPGPNGEWTLAQGAMEGLGLDLGRQVAAEPPVLNLGMNDPPRAKTIEDDRQRPGNPRPTSIEPGVGMKPRDADEDQRYGHRNRREEQGDHQELDRKPEPPQLARWAELPRDGRLVSLISWHPFTSRSKTRKALLTVRSLGANAGMEQTFRR